MSHYPVILIPDVLQQVQPQLIPQPIKPNYPKRPKPPPPLPPEPQPLKVKAFLIGVLQRFLKNSAISSETFIPSSFYHLLSSFHKHRFAMAIARYSFW